MNSQTDNNPTCSVILCTTVMIGVIGACYIGMDAKKVSSFGKTIVAVGTTAMIGCGCKSRRSLKYIDRTCA